MRAALSLSALLLLSGCARTAPQRKDTLVDRDGIDVVGSPADRVHVVIKDAKSHERYCLGPGPDFSVTTSGGLNVGATGGPVPGGSVGETSGRGSLDLGGRTSAVLLAREMFYRTCELIVNTHADQASAIAVFKATMDAVERVAALQSPNAAAVASAAPPVAAAGLPAGLTPPAVSTSAATASPASDDSDNQ